MRSHRRDATVAAKLQPAKNPAAPTPARSGRPRAGDALLSLQRRYGNRFVQRLVRGGQESTVDERTRSRLERAFGTDLSSVTVTRRPEVASLGAVAVTRGERIDLAPAQRVDTPEGQEVLAHEVAHVMQQRQGRVRPQVRLGGVGVSVDPRLEAEADTVARRVRGGAPAGMIAPATPATGTAVVQRKAVLKRGNDTVSEDDLTSSELRAWLLERPQLKDLIPAGWWIDAERTKLRVVPLRPALKAVVAATTDYGTFDLAVAEDVTKLCTAMLDVARATASTDTSPAPRPPSVPALLPGIVNFPAPAEDRPGREAQKPLRAEYVTNDNRDQIERTLAAWTAYAKSQREPLRDRYFELKHKREELRAQYYERSNEELRKEFKKVNLQRAHMTGAAGECEKVLGNIAEAANRSGGLNRFMALYHEDQLQGIVEWSSTAADYISNIVGNPYNIVPQDAPVVGGVAKALVLLTVTQYRSERAHSSSRRPGQIELYALNNKVKGIYDHFHFRVVIAGQPVERPSRGQKEKDRLASLRPQKTPWHKEYRMAITDEAATELIRKVTPGKWLTVPENLKRYLDPDRT
jgi:hypothetical protein